LMLKSRHFLFMWLEYCPTLRSHPNTPKNFRDACGKTEALLSGSIPRHTPNVLKEAWKFSKRCSGSNQTVTDCTKNGGG